MGPYYSTQNVTVPTYPEHPIFRDILFNRLEDFVGKCECSDEKVYNESGEDPIQYICQLGVTQQRYEMLCYLIDCKRYEISYEVIRPLLNRNGSLVKCYLLRLLLTVGGDIPSEQVVYSTTSEANYTLFVEYGLGNCISLIKDVDYDLQ